VRIEKHLVQLAVNNKKSKHYPNMCLVQEKLDIYEVFGSNSSGSASIKQQTWYYPDMHLVGSWSDGVKKLNEIVNDDKLNPNVAHGLEILRQYVWKENEDTNIGPRVYINEEERATATSYMRNCYDATNEPFTEVVSKTKKKNLKKGVHVHNTCSRDRLPY